MRIMTALTASIALIAIALLLPGAALAQEGGQAAGQDAGARIEASLQAAARADIPAGLLETKIQEGRAKGVAEARIASAVEARMAGLLRAREAMTRAGVEAVTAGDLSVTADALEAGVSESALVEIHRRAPRERRTVATAVLGGLVRLGHGSEHAMMQVRGALQRGPGALADLRARTAARLRMRGGGVPPSLEAGIQGRGAIGMN